METARTDVGTGGRVTGDEPRRPRPPPGRTLAPAAGDDVDEALSGTTSS